MMVAKDSDGKTVISVGPPIMVRPYWSDLVRSRAGSNLPCSCGQPLQTPEALREHWQAGHFDIQDRDPAAAKTVTEQAAEREPVSEKAEHPLRSSWGKIEVIDFIEDQQLGFHLGNVVMYICGGYKGDIMGTLESLEKAEWHLHREIQRLKYPDLTSKQAAHVEDRRTAPAPRGQ